MKAGLTCAVVAVSLVGACSPGDAGPDRPRDRLGRAAVVVGQGDENRPVAVSVGGSIVVQLPAAPPLGWSVDGPLDGSVVKLVSSGYRPSVAGGDSGLAVLTFEATGSGSLSVHLVYGPASDPSAVSRQFTFIVSVT